MIGEIARAIVRMVVDPSGLKTGLAAGKKETEKATSQMSGGFRKLASIAFPAGIAVGIVAVGKHALETMDRTAKMSRQFGVSVEELSRLDHAASLSGVATEQLGASMLLLSRNMYMARRGAVVQKEAFENLGIQVKDSSGKLRSAHDVLLDLAEKFQSMPDGAEKTAAAIAVMGTQGAKMVPLLDEGRDGIVKLEKEAERLGIAIDTSTAEAAEQFSDNMSRMKSTATGAGLQLTGALLPGLNAIGESMASHSTDIKSWYSPMGALVKIGKGVIAMLAATVGQIKLLASESGIAFDAISSIAVAVIQKRWADIPRIVKGTAKNMKDELATSANDVLKQWDVIFNGIDKKAAESNDQQRSDTSKTGKVATLTADQISAMAEKMKLANLQLELQAAEARGDAAAVAKLKDELRALEEAQLRAQGATSADVKKMFDLQDAAEQAGIFAAGVKDKQDQLNSAIAAGQADLEAERLATIESAAKKEIAIRDKLLQAEADRIKSAIPLLKRLGEEYEANATKMEEVYRSATMNVEGLFTDVLFAGVTGKVHEIDDILKGFLKNLLRQIINLMAQRAIMAFLSSFGGGLTTNSSGFISAWSASPGVIGKAGGGVFSGGFTPFSSGGIVTKPTLGLVGEGNFSEAVVPMPHGNIPVEIRGNQPQETVIHQRITLGSDLIAAMRPSQDEIVSAVTSSILLNGEVRNTIRRRGR